MGNYAPYAPQDLGMQWVPIKQSSYVPDQETERGYTFSIDHSVIPVSGSYNIQDNPVALSSNPAEFISLYAAGTESETGPIHKVTIPVSAAVATGTGFTPFAGVSLVDSLANPADGLVVAISTAASPPSRLGLSFDVTSFQSALQGKRILNVDFVYRIAGVPTSLDAISFVVERLSSIGSGNVTYDGPVGPINQTASDGNNASSLGWLNPFWQTPGLAGTTQHIYPWRYEELALFAPTAGANRLVFTILNFLLAGQASASFDYAVLEVTFCEERRLKYGGDQKFGAGGITLSNYKPGTSFAMLRNTDFSVSGSIAPGAYTITHTHSGYGKKIDYANAPTIYAIRQLYELPSHSGVIVTKSLIVDTEFAETGTNILPQIALHHAGAVVTGSHVYGKQIGAPVYGAVTAIQDVDADSATGQQYPRVRFYARRFGDTTIALTLRSVSVPGTNVSISVADFDALPEIVDGWKEVTLRFAGTIPTFTGPAGTAQAWQWDAVGETAGNQWQVLGADGPSVTGAQTYGPATYFAPFGATEELTWTNPLTGTSSADTITDAVIIFAQDPPTISGFTLTPSTQAVTGIGLACGAPPRCIPTGISYTAITWTAQTGIPVTGFGQYELERFDALDGEWQQIMSASSPAVTGFNDYEARVGVASDYRIRACDALDFCGPWTTGSATIPAPGVTPGGVGVLIFTSNANQAGAYNLAHVMQWEGGSAQENFTFPEAQSVVLQDMYNKDFPTAFRPLERGGEQFSRVLLVQGAAISAESLANFRSLRDMAWADVPYIAVRDELGNRWYATVLVPNGNVRRNRTLYFAQVDVIETTDTASQVDPS